MKGKTIKKRKKIKEKAWWIDHIPRNKKNKTHKKRKKKGNRKKKVR